MHAIAASHALRPLLPGMVPAVVGNSPCCAVRKSVCVSCLLAGLLYVDSLVHARSEHPLVGWSGGG